MKYGVSYYPEHRKSWDEIDGEIALMCQAGINVVRMGEFAWCRFEPEEGKYDFSWLDKVIEKLGSCGIESIICTPTACPPAWMLESHPEIHYIDNRGVARPFGGRRHYCYNQPVYRMYSEKVAEAIGRHYGGNKYVAGFQIDNEMAQESTGRCHCDYCGQKFQEWLKNKYDTIGQLNDRMGTIFWGQSYNHFGQVKMPISTTELCSQDHIINYYDNPSLRLDFERYCSQSIVEYQDLQLNQLKRFTNKTVTTNSTGLYTNSIDYFKSYERLDRYAMDAYPNLAGEDLGYVSFEYSFARNNKKNKFWILEFSSGGGHGLWGKEGRLQPYPGALKQAAIHGFASGAELLAHFQFRVFPFGAEQLNYAILDQDGIPRRRFYELKETVEELKALDRILTESDICKKEVAICMDYDTLWALKIKPIHKNFDYNKYCVQIYNIFQQLGYEADVVSYEQDLTAYKLVIVPTPIMMEERFKKKLKSYVNQGGTAVSTFLTSVKNTDNVATSDSLPGGLGDLFGIVVEEVEPVFDSSQATVTIKAGDKDYKGRNQYWCEMLKIQGAEILGIITDTYRKDMCVASKNLYGRGKAYYLGTGLDDTLMKEFMKEITSQVGISALPIQAQKGIEIVSRALADKKMYFVFNTKKEESTIKLNHNYIDMVKGEVLEKELRLPAKGYICISTWNN